MADTGFSQRLNLACDGHPHVPAYGQGRQSWIKENLGVSHEAVSRWFAGASRPRPSKMKALAKVLDVDEAWLALGITPASDPAEMRVRNVQAEGASNTLMGLAQLNGASVALPDDKDPRAAFVDFYAVFRGQQVPFHVALADEIAAATYKVTVPLEYDRCVTVTAVHRHSMRVHFLRMPIPLIDRHKSRRGGYFELIMTHHNDKYMTGQDEWTLIRDFNDF